MRLAKRRIRMMIPATIAMIKLQMTPAMDTEKFATRLSLQRKGFTGVGFAQPNKGAPVKKESAGNNNVPMGSTCTAGFRLIRPNNLAVSSPKWSDVQACADSCTESEKISATI